MRSSPAAVAQPLHNQPTTLECAGSREGCTTNLPHCSVRVVRKVALYCGQAFPARGNHQPCLRRAGWTTARCNSPKGCNAIHPSCTGRTASYATDPMVHPVDGYETRQQHFDRTLARHNKLPCTAWCSPHADIRRLHCRGLASPCSQPQEY